MYVHSIHNETEFRKALDSSCLVVVDFAATWCGPCKALAPKLEAMAKQYSSVRFFKVDVDSLNNVAQMYQINAMPTVLYMRRGMELTRVVGANVAKIEDAIRKHM